MDLVTLNDDNVSDVLIENYDSLIWTERFTNLGDFQLITGDVSRFMDVLPEGQIVSLRQSRVPMIVEDHLIERKKNQPVKLTIVGREYTSILDRRIAIKAVMAALDEWLVVAKLPSDIAHYIIYKVCVEGIVDPKDIFPSSEVVFLTPDDYLTSSGPNREYVVTRGNLLEVVQQLLASEGPADPSTTPPTPLIEPHGLRALRPDSSGPIGIEIYKGTDRSAEIYFDGTRNLLDDGAYAFSKRGSATDAYVLGDVNAVKVGQEKTGLDRRVILLEDSNENASVEALQGNGSTAIAQNKPVARFNGSINQDLSPYLFGVDYDLGDIVKFVGDYGLEEKARLVEYIRSEGPDGNKEFPTFAALADFYEE